MDAVKVISSDVDFLIDKDWYEDDLFERMLCTETSQYYNWTSDRTKFIDSQSEQETTKEEAKAEWEEICAEYKGKNHYSEAPDFEEIWETIDYNINPQKRGSFPEIASFCYFSINLLSIFICPVS